MGEDRRFEQSHDSNSNDSQPDRSEFIVRKQIKVLVPDFATGLTITTTISTTSTTSTTTTNRTTTKTTGHWNTQILDYFKVIV